MTDIDTTTEGTSQDDTLVTPSKHYPSGRASRLGTLAIGESFAEAKRLPIATATKDEIRAQATALKGTMSKAISNAVARTGFVYKSESLQTMTQSSDIMVIQVVTRVE